VARKGWYNAIERCAVVRDTVPSPPPATGIAPGAGLLERHWLLGTASPFAHVHVVRAIRFTTSTNSWLALAGVVSELTGIAPVLPLLCASANPRRIAGSECLSGYARPGSADTRAKESLAAQWRNPR
jgi:hypothetical protein